MVENKEEKIELKGIELYRLIYKYRNGMSDEEKNKCLLDYPNINFNTKKLNLEFWLTSWKDVCNLVDIPINYFDEKYGDILSNDEIAYKKLKLIVNILNEGWSPNWDDTNEKKWYPWFYMDDKGGGFRFGGADCTWASAYSVVGSRLCFKNKELVEHAAKYFIDIYKEFMCVS